jgi:hypothetical protein
MPVKSPTPICKEVILNMNLQVCCSMTDIVALSMRAMGRQIKKMVEIYESDGYRCKRSTRL